MSYYEDICTICDLDINDYFEGIRSKDDYCDDCKDVIEDYETKRSLQ